MEFKIESGIPIPPPPKRKLGKYPWHYMKPGDSFFVPINRRLKNQGQSLKQQAAYRSQGDVKFEAREVDGGFRIWRTS